MAQTATENHELPIHQVQLRVVYRDQRQPINPLSLYNQGAHTQKIQTTSAALALLS